MHPLLLLDLYVGIAATALPHTQVRIVNAPIVVGGRPWQFELSVSSHPMSNRWGYHWDEVDRAQIAVFDPDGKRRQVLPAHPDSPESFFASFVLRDVDFDGQADIWFEHDRAKCVRSYEIWRFAGVRFVADELTRRLGRIWNLEVDPDRHQLLSEHHCDSVHNRYRIEQQRLVQLRW